MKKTVAVDGRLGNLIKELEARGYRVVDIYGDARAVDACIYYDGIRDFHNTDLDTGGGILMINGKGVTVDEVVFALERGTYSSLF